jgi:hypothetical protein
MPRLFILIPDVELTETIVTELAQLDIPHSRMHVVASINQHLSHLPKASVWQKTELAHGLEWGTGIGGTAGLLGGLLTVAFPPGGIVLGGGALLIGAAAGAGVGAAMMGLMKGHEHNHQLDDFKAALDAGEILLMLDVPQNETESVSRAILDLHPDAEISISVPA